MSGGQWALPWLSRCPAPSDLATEPSAARLALRSMAGFASAPAWRVWVRSAPWVE